jgi:hypothetical protein
MKHPGGRDYEGDCRSWRIAICSCDAVGDNSDAFLIERHYQSELSTPNLSSYSLEPEMHAALLLGFSDCQNVHDLRLADRQMSILVIHGGGYAGNGEFRGHIEHSELRVP